MDRVILPSQWVNVVKQSRLKNPFRIIFVEHPVTDDLEDDGTPIIKVMDYKKSSLPTIFPSKIKDISKMKGVIFTKTGALGRRLMNADPNIDLGLSYKRSVNDASARQALTSANPAFSTYIPIKQAKANDVATLLESVVLPNTCTFYSTIVGDGAAENGDSNDDDSECEL